MIPAMPANRCVSIWSPETKFRIWFEIEAHATDALGGTGHHAEEAAANSGRKAATRNSTWRRSDEIEREAKHNVIAFLTYLSEIVGPEARFAPCGHDLVHVLDTCLNVARCAPPIF